ncbi:hypothetical protein [Halalkalibacter krulwichiae]|uniref:Uncharacterized protein n=1 Tax=Halalkalibacter krulwichiae TaxID=199441 RepID=A0A1X9MI52_9BACI|nr:hypothetical protein [Halalkalibacter krulwichiae]ARK32310.1 hypothetical protein BkAM31D_22000 [Halalkalibacter krulwichiae]
MEEIIDRVLGFLPHRSTIWSAIILALSIGTAQYVYHTLSEIFLLPWQKQENQHMRKTNLSKEKSGD